MDIEEYLKTEFRRYFPEAVEIDTWQLDQGETLIVRIVKPYKVDAPALYDYRFECGSDDDWYVFEAENPEVLDRWKVITIPLMPEVE